jgi:hypothetical protein
MVRKHAKYTAAREREQSRIAASGAAAAAVTASGGDDIWGGIDDDAFVDMSSQIPSSSSSSSSSSGSGSGAGGTGKDGGCSWAEMAVLFRCFKWGFRGALHTELQAEMQRRKVPFSVVGGHSIFERKEVLVSRLTALGYSR